MEFTHRRAPRNMSRRAASRIASFVKADRRACWELATGTTPIGFTRASLTIAHAEEQVRFADVTTFNLDSITRSSTIRELPLLHESTYSSARTSSGTHARMCPSSNPDAEAVTCTSLV